MSQRYALPSLLALGALTLPSLAWAEVKDKVMPPWGTFPLVATVIVTGVCALLAWRPRWAPALLAAMLSSAWAVLRLEDDFNDPFVGPAIRAEFSAMEVLAWQWLRPLQAFLPALITTCFILTRGLRRSRTVSAS